MAGFLGEYEVTLDSKGRFLLPAGIKKQVIGENVNQFVVTRGIEKCLNLYTEKSWEAIFAKLSELNDFDSESRSFRRIFLSGSLDVELDSAGRLLLPKNLVEYAGLEKDVVLVSAIEKIEIWDKGKYTQFFDTISPDEFSKLANRVMNNKKITD